MHEADFILYTLNGAVERGLSTWLLPDCCCRRSEAEYHTGPRTIMIMLMMLMMVPYNVRMLLRDVKKGPT